MIWYRTPSLPERNALCRNYRIEGRIPRALVSNTVLIQEGGILTHEGVIFRHDMVLGSHVANYDDKGR